MVSALSHDRIPAPVTAIAPDRAVDFGTQLRRNAAARGNAPAVVAVAPDGSESVTSWSGLDRMVDGIATELHRRGVAQGTVVALALGNGLAHVAITLAIWRLGATVMSVDPGLPSDTLADLCRCAGAPGGVVEPGGAVAGWRWPRTEVMAAAAQLPPEIPHDLTPRPGRIVLSGGSVGRPKLMSDDQPWRSVPGMPWQGIPARLGFRPGQVQLVGGAMSHSAPLTWAHLGLFEGQMLVVMEKFDARLALRLIARHRVRFMMAVPTMMVRLLDVVEAVDADLSSLEALYHTAAPCPVWLKRAWIDRLGPERVFEMYGSGEGAGQTIITGTEWLVRPGSVGRPYRSEIRIRDERGRILPAGQVGQVFMRNSAMGGPARYLDPAHELQVDDEGFACVGDLGSLDVDGYLYIAGRRDDAIITGGLKVQPERVEAVLLGLPGVADVVVFGVEDREWGQRVHAAIVPRPGMAPTLGDIRAAAAAHLAPTELPKSIELRSRLPRDGFGKIRRRALAAAAGYLDIPSDNSLLG